MVKRTGAGGRRGGSGGGSRPASKRAKKAGGKARADAGSKPRSARGTGRRPSRGEAPPDGRARDRRGLLGPRDGRVVAILRTSSEGQRLTVEDEARVRWQVDCLGEAVGEGARIRFESVAGGAERCGVLIRVLDDEREAWVCTLRRRGSALELVPFGAVELPPLVLAPRQTKRAEEGDRVLVAREAAAPKRKVKAKRERIGRRREETLSVRVVEILGPAGDPDADHRAIAWKYRLPADFSRRARLEVEELPDVLSAAVLMGRLDLRHLPFITIDPASARDHDDALYAEGRPRPALELVRAKSEDASDATGLAARPSRNRREDESWTERLWVAIADVAHFVAVGSFIDAEARRRGNSFYFPDRAIPMLPERLSSELCSLRPDEDRLVLVVELRLSATGAVLDALFHEAVIRSHAKLSYEQAADWLARANGDPGPSGGPGPGPRPGSGATWPASLERLARIATRLGERRRTVGAIELELPEVEIVVDATGRPIDAVLRNRNPAHGLVEEAMLAANQAVAKALERAHRDTLHRVHPAPDPRRLEELGQLLERFGVPDAGDLEEPGAIAAMLQAVRGWPSKERIHLATLRSMSQARYEARSRGHFALQFPHYLHFTSPIRRYADLVVHRALKRLLRGEIGEIGGRGARGEPDESPTARDAAGGEADLERLAAWLSGRERVAVDAEREAAAFACCALLAGREGEAFEAEVTGIGEHGLFVRLTRPAASGLVPLRSLDRRWRLDEEGEFLEEGRAGRRIEVGSPIRVRLAHVDGDRGRIAFALAGTGDVPSRREKSPHLADQASPDREDQESARLSDSDSHSR